jgi:hypothetical protein
MAMTSAQVRMARAALNWTVRDLAEAAGLHRNIITNIEVGRYSVILKHGRVHRQEWWGAGSAAKEAAPETELGCREKAALHQLSPLASSCLCPTTTSNLVLTRSLVGQ